MEIARSIEANDNSHSIEDGVQQALKYAETLNLQLAFSSNGDGFVFHDKTGLNQKLKTVLNHDSFPAPENLSKPYCNWKGLTEDD